MVTQVAQQPQQQWSLLLSDITCHDAGLWIVGLHKQMFDSTLVLMIFFFLCQRFCNPMYCINRQFQTNLVSSFSSLRRNVFNITSKSSEFLSSYLHEDHLRFSMISSSLLQTPSSRTASMAADCQYGWRIISVWNSWIPTVPPWWLDVRWSSFQSLFFSFF